jgi:hypothetical protein
VCGEGNKKKSALVIRYFFNKHIMSLIQQVSCIYDAYYGNLGTVKVLHWTGFCHVLEDQVEKKKKTKTEKLIHPI